MCDVSKRNCLELLCTVPNFIQSIQSLSIFFAAKIEQSSTTKLSLRSFDQESFRIFYVNLGLTESSVTLLSNGSAETNRVWDIEARLGHEIECRPTGGPKILVIYLPPLLER